MQSVLACLPECRPERTAPPPLFPGLLETLKRGTMLPPAPGVPRALEAVQLSSNPGEKSARLSDLRGSLM